MRGGKVILMSFNLYLYCEFDADDYERNDICDALACVIRLFTVGGHHFVNLHNFGRVACSCLLIINTMDENRVSVYLFGILCQQYL